MIYLKHQLDDWSEGSRVLHFYMANGGDWIEFKVKKLF